MTKPPKSTAHSDIDGVHRDERPNTQSAEEAGETAADLAHAKEQAKARPEYSDEKSRDDRSR